MLTTYQLIADSQRIEIIFIGFITISGKLNQGVSSGMQAEATPTIQKRIFIVIGFFPVAAKSY